MTAVATISPHLTGIDAPTALRNEPGWLIWRFEHEPGVEKPRKVPYYATGGKRHGEQGGTKDLGQLTTFDNAKRRAAQRGFDGVGFATLEQFNICALDFDNCVEDGRVLEEVEGLLLNTYAEYSPSGKGVRAFFKGNLGNGKDIRGTGYGMEVFSTRGFVTFTGQPLEIVQMMGNTDEVIAITPEVRALHARRFERERASATSDGGEIPPLGLSPDAIDALLAAIDPDCSHDDWLHVGMGLHHETRGEGFELWDHWSALGGKYPGTDVLWQRWVSFGKYTGAPVTLRTAQKLAGHNPNTPATAEEFEILTEAAVAVLEAKPPRFNFQPVHEFSSTTALPWMIKGVLPKAGLTVIYGASGSGKSFAALDMGMAIARGLEWRGRKTRQGRVAYIAAEGAEGFKKRVAAYAQQQSIDLTGVPMTVLNAAPNLMEKQDAVDIVAGIKASGGADLIVVDTFAQAMPGANENAGEDVGKALGYCKRIHEITGAMVLLIHHSGKDAAKGARGWSGLRAACDAELEVVREVGGRYLRLSKNKDGEDGLEWGFDLEVVQLGLDEDLDPITSCVVVETAMPAKGGVANRKLSKNQLVVNEVLQEFALAQTSGIEIGAVLNEAVRRMMVRDGVEADKKGNYKTNARRSLHSLCEGDDAPYWLDPDTNTIEVV